MPKRVPTKNFSRPPVADTPSPADAPSAPQTLSKASAFAKSCETAGWTVTRKIRGRDTDAPVRTVTAVREDETVTATWAGERALPYGEFGTYTLADATGGPLLSRKLSGAKQALEYVQTPIERVKRPVAAGVDGETVVRDLDWDPVEEENSYVLANVAGKTLRWVGKLPDGRPSDVQGDRVPITTWEDVEVTQDGKKTTVQRQTSNRQFYIQEYLDGRRILVFISAETGLFRSVNLADLVSVS